MDLLNFLVKGQLLEAVIESIEYNRHGNLLTNPTNLYNIITCLPENIRNEAIRKLASYDADFSQKMEGSNQPLVFELKGLIGDEGLSLMLNNKTCKGLVETLNTESIRNFIKDCFAKNKTNTINTLIEEYWLISKSEINKYNELSEKYSKELYDIVKLTGKNIEEYSKINYSNYGMLVCKIVSELLEDNNNHKLVENIIKENILQIEDDYKEKLISTTLQNTKNTKLTKAALDTIGIKNIQQYKPKNYQIWIYCDEHKDEKIYEKLLTSGIDPLSYSKSNNNCFLANLIVANRKNLISQDVFLKIEKDTHRQLLNKSLVDLDCNNFSMLASTNDSDICRFLTLDKKDWEAIEPALSGVNLENISQDTFITIDNLLRKTLFAVPYKPEHDEAVKLYNTNRKNNFSLLFTTETRPYNVDILMKAHLDYVINNDLSEYKKQYFEIFSSTIISYSMRMVDNNSPMGQFYKEILKYVRDYETDEWEKINDNINNPNTNHFINDKSELMKHLYSEVESIFLRESLTNKENIKSKTSFKI